MHIAYTPDIDSEIYTLDEQESFHCIKVLRLTEGDKLVLLNGRGGIFKVRIDDIKDKRCMVRVINHEKIEKKRNYNLHIAIAPTKKMDRFEFFIEKSTEIGIDNITPIITQHSERKKIKHERLEAIITAAMKQSINPFRPVLNDMVTIKELLTKELPDNKYIAHCKGENRTNFYTIKKPGKDIIILIGPEGDFSNEEIDKAKEKGFIEIALGESRLRTETAGIVACHSLSILAEIVNY